MGAMITVSTHYLGDKLVGNIVNPKTLGNDETIKEAIQYNYVIGQPEQIGYNAKGVLKSMIKGISKDADGRKIDEFFSVQPTIKGKGDDITDDIDKSKIAVLAKARALKKLKLDTSDWNVMIEGTSGALAINGISTGEESGQIVIGEDVGINGFGLKLGEGDTISWSVPEAGKSGVVAAAKLTSDMTRITIDGDALEELDDSAYNGMQIIWTLKIGTCRGVKSALIVVK